MARGRNRGRRDHHRPAKHPRFELPDDDGNVDMRDVRGVGGISKHHTHNHGYETRSRRNNRRPRQDYHHRHGQPNHFPLAAGEEYTEDLDSDADDDVYVPPPEIPSLFSPAGDLSPVLGNQFGHRSWHQNNNNHNNNPFLKKQQQQYTAANNHSSPFQQQRQQEREHRRQLRQSNNKRQQQLRCEDCRVTRKANLRRRNALLSHLQAAAATLAEWSKDVGVPFGGSAADDEMDWQPEPVIRVVFMQPQPQQQQQQEQHDDERIKNNTNGDDGLFPGAVGGGGYYYGGGGGGGFYSGYNRGATLWSLGLETADSELEESAEEAPEESYRHVVSGPNPFFRSPPGSSFASYSGVSPFGALAGMTNEPNPFLPSVQYGAGE